MIKVIENNDFEAVKNSEYAVVDFNATWCGPCRMLAPIIEELADELDEVEFFACDVDENDELAAQNGIQSIPAVGIFKNGELVDMMVGFKPKDAMKEFVLSKK
ncbi:MAG: thioredoxin [Ruminococcus sp.]|nr:thioredoxin [Ruminococcus sp.]